jgi:3-dehydroquinate synthase
VTGPRLGGADQWMALMRGDKKTRDGEITFVLMPRIGEAVCRGAPSELVARVIERNTR